MDEQVRKIRLLMVDDEEEFLTSSSQALSRRGFDVYVAPNGVTALEMIEQEEFEVVVLDVKMPGMGGLEVLRRIKDGLPSVQVILLTGHPSVESAIEGIRLGADEYMNKPPEVEELVATIRRLYENRQKAKLKYQKELIEEIRRRYLD